MKKILLPLSILLFALASCCPEPKDMTKDQIDAEKEAIIKVVKDYNKASEEKNFSAMVDILASEVIFFGTDSSEIIRSFGEFKRQMLEQWERYDKMDYGDLVDVSIQMDKKATFASIIYGSSCKITKDNTEKLIFLRTQRTLVKEKDKWVIISGIVGAVQTGDLLTDLLDNNGNPIDSTKTTETK